MKESIIPFSNSMNEKGKEQSFVKEKKKDLKGRVTRKIKIILPDIEARNVR